MAEVCRDVTIEPRLQPVTGEEFIYRSANTDDDARLDVKAKVVSGRTTGKMHFLTVEFLTLSCKQPVQPEGKAYRAYEEWVINIEQYSPCFLSLWGHGTSSPSGIQSPSSKAS